MEEMTMEEEEEEAETTRKFVNFHRIRTRKMPEQTPLIEEVRLWLSGMP